MLEALVHGLTEPLREERRGRASRGSMRISSLAFRRSSWKLRGGLFYMCIHEWHDMHTCTPA